MPLAFDVPDMYRATAESVREQLVENWNATYKHFHEENPKQAYYILHGVPPGPCAHQRHIGNLGLVGEYSDALRTLGYSLEDCAGVERNMGLGNGGLGRLAACFLDSIATLDLPAWGYGLRYKYGLFKQAIDPETGQQMEYADDWLEVGNPWEVKRTTAHKIGFYGEIVDGKWVPAPTSTLSRTTLLSPATRPRTASPSASGTPRWRPRSSTSPRSTPATTRSP